MLARTSRWARERGRRLPHVRWRDHTIESLTTALEQAVDVEVPSYRRLIHAERRMAAMAVRRGDRGQVTTRKLKSYAFAQSHGVAIPRVFDVWDRIQDIDWDDLPAAVVLKSNGGTGGRGVVPMRREGKRWRMISAGGEALPSAQIVELLRSREDLGSVRGPYFAEELLPGVAADCPPVDAKVYAFYGEVGFVLLRSVAAHGTGKSFRSILPDGSDFGRSCPNDVYDTSIPVPVNFADVLRAAERLSLAVPRAFVRVDLYDLGDRVVFGEFTPRPGGSEDYGPELDAHLGRLWERAQRRVLDDVLGGAGWGLRFGPGPGEITTRRGVWRPEPAEAPTANGEVPPAPQ